MGQEETTRQTQFVMDADEPPVLLSKDRAANPVEYVLHALAGCMTTSIAYHAAAQGVEISEMSSSFEGDIDLQGFLGIDPDVPRGYSEIRVRFRIACNGSEKLLREWMSFSPVYSMISKALPVRVEFEIH